jgi:hypothetical protein
MKNAVLYILILLAIWLLFIRKADGYCGACGGAA